MGDLKTDLMRDAELIETHTAWVFLHADRVYKVKKPVDFGFLNFTSRERRRTACEAEVELNARLAPSVYHRVVPVYRDAAGHHSLEPGQEVVDFAVEMQRLADSQRADNLLEQGQLTRAHVEQLAAMLAEFHARMPTSATIARYGLPEVLLEHLDENFRQTQASIGEHVSKQEAAEIFEHQRRFVDRERDRLVSRALAGRVRDGHGDLRLEHVYFREEVNPTIIDCIEFNERFRYGDVCADIAFLSMDLARAGRVDLAEQFLATYARLSDDFDLYPLIDFYEGYRAFVRAKVASMLEADTGAAFEARKQAKQLARRHYLLALSSGRASLLAPVVVAVGGMIGAGKSTTAEAVGELLSAPVISSDRTRKHLLGVTATTDVRAEAWGGAYSPGFTDKVYTELLRRAAAVLTSGRPVVLDASFRSEELRARARLLSVAYGVPFYFVECRAPEAERRRRLEGRAAGPHVSDARAELMGAFAAEWQSVRELEEREHVVLETTQPREASLETLRRRLPGWPQGLTQ